jgi:hypothetical protein
VSAAFTVRRALPIVLVAAQYGCAGSPSNECAVDQDCASGFCQADHTCAPVEGDGGRPDASIGIDARPGCDPDHDGTVERDERPLAPGRTATYRMAEDATIDTAGTIDGQGRHTWTLDADLPGDEDRDLELIDPAGTWWEDVFPGATYATTLSASSDLLGVFALDDTRLQLLGVVSPTGGTTRTELVYDPPVDTLVLPLAPSDDWVVDTTVSGLAQGFAAYYTERYESRVDAVGTMDTPYGEFPVSRVAVDLTRQVGAGFVTSRTFAFVAECYSTVATIVSQDYEADAEFTDAAEVRRLAP